MSYTLIEMEKDIENISHELSELRAKKGHDYSGSEDTLDNLREFGWKGVIVRIGDKFKRLKHFIVSDQDLQCKDESIEDTLQDLINYSNYALIMYRQEKASTSCSSDVLNEEGFASKARGDILPRGIRFDGIHYIDEDIPNTLFLSMRDWEEYQYLQHKTPNRLPGMAQTKKKPEILEWVNDVDIPTGEV